MGGKMRGIARLLSAGIAMLLVTGALAQPPAQPQDTTPCRKIAPERLSVPDDFSLSFRSGPTHADWGTTTITTVNASGRATITEVRRAKGRSGPREEKTTERQLSKQAIQRVYASVVACGFFELDKSYWNRKVMDGSTSSLQITAGGKKHQVVVHHYTVERFRTIVSALNEALEK
jgi:hypothetical protein